MKNTIIVTSVNKEIFSSYDLVKPTPPFEWELAPFHMVIPRNGRVEEHDEWNPCLPLDHWGNLFPTNLLEWDFRSIIICLVGTNFTVAQWEGLECAVTKITKAVPSVKYIGGYDEVLRIENLPPEGKPGFPVYSWYLEWTSRAKNAPNRLLPIPEKREEFKDAARNLATRLLQIT